MSNKETIKEIERLMLSGASRQTIFDTIGHTDDSARLVAAVPTFHDRKRFSKANTTLFIIFIYIAMIKTLFPIVNSISASLPLIVVLPFALFWSCVAMFLAIINPASK